MVTVPGRRKHLLPIRGLRLCEQVGWLRGEEEVGGRGLGSNVFQNFRERFLPLHPHKTEGVLEWAGA